MSILSIASSGLAAASLRLQVSASNVANMSDTGALPDANASSTAPAYVPLRVDQTAGAGTSASVATFSPSYVPQYDPAAPYADSNGQVAAPNVDLANEIVQQIDASIAFAANAKALQAGSSMIRGILDMKI
jgi:flagellar basal-body rod protein FlgC